MKKFNQKNLVLLTIGILTPLTITTSKVNANTFGAQIFCTMRNSGNDHRSSWEAAYSYIKQQKGGLFKVSPKRAASQITESVIRESEKFSYCIEYLDNLYPDRKLIQDLKNEEKRKEKELEETNEEFSQEFTNETLDRYSY